MDTLKLHVVFPNDETTDFLKEISEYISNKTEAQITLHRLSTIQDHLSFKDQAQAIISQDSIVLFMGHGMSNALSGAIIGRDSYGPFITDNELSIFRNRKIILLTCRSNEYLKKFGKECGIKAGIGFPNLITDIYETYYPEDSERDRVYGISEVEINDFKKVITDIVKHSLEDFINNNLTFYQLYKRIQLYSRKNLIEFYKSKPFMGKLPYGKMLYDLNDGISLVGN